MFSFYKKNNSISIGFIRNEILIKKKRLKILWILKFRTKRKEMIKKKNTYFWVIIILFVKQTFLFPSTKFLKFRFLAHLIKKSRIFVISWKWEIASNDRKLQSEVWIVFWTYLVCSSIYFFVPFIFKNTTLIHYSFMFLCEKKSIL